MKVVASFCIVGATMLSASPVLAAGEPRNMLIQSISDGSIVSTTSLPADTVLHIDAASTSMARTIMQYDIQNTTTATGHAVLVATRGGKEIATLRGDQLVITQMQVYTGKPEGITNPRE
jgi:hypothetical protein